MAQDSTATPHCVVCSQAGKTPTHRMGSSNCESAAEKKILKRPSAEPGRRTDADLTHINAHKDNAN